MKKSHVNPERNFEAGKKIIIDVVGTYSLGTTTGKGKVVDYITEQAILEGMIQFINSIHPTE